MYTREQERESIQKTVAAFEKVLGQKPTGYLSPGHASTPHTLELVAEAGFVWWADPLNSDNPYTVESKGRKVVVVPYNVPGCNDYSTYGAGRTPRDLLQTAKDQFDYLYWEGEQGAPSSSPSTCTRSFPALFRTKIVDEFIRYAKGLPKSGSRAASRLPTGAWRRAFKTWSGSRERGRFSGRTSR
jgi:peptidoglycan/xylan/chitin deacetylase (PgdA/CDA1 family)